MLGVSVDQLPDGRGKHSNHFRGEREPLYDRFWAKVQKTDGCWIWTGAVDSSGYGWIGVVGRKTRAAHRLSYEWHNGEILPGKCVCHRCDNPGCVNPDHLWLGTHADNIRDRDRKGRCNGGSKPGEDAAHALLKDDDVITIRKLCAAGHQQKDVAERFGVHKATVNDVVLRKTWGHI